MSIQDQFSLATKIKRYDENSVIYNLFIFNKSGICFYGRNFSDHFDVEKNLVSPFLTALMSFSEEMIGKRFETIEMGDIKFVIFQKNSLFYCVLCDSMENITLLNDIISKINKKVATYIRKNKIKIDAEIVYDSKLNKTIEEIIKDTLSNEFDIQREEKIIEYLKDIAFMDELDGIILLTDRGKVIHSTFYRNDLKNFLKEVEFRVKIHNNSILRLFYTFKNEKFIFSEYVLDLYFVIIVFKSNVKFGLAEHYLTKIVNSIKRILLD